MTRSLWIPVVVLAGLLATSTSAQGQTRPYIGYVYPAGGQQGTTFQVKLGGQGLDDVNGVLVSGPGVSGKVVEYFRKLGPQEMTLLREQMAEIRKGPGKKDAAIVDLTARIEKRMKEYVQRPACASISSVVVAEIAMEADAPPGPRELRLVTLRGISNPLVFHVGQLPEHSRKAMLTSELQVLGKEELALRKRPPEEVEVSVTLPCTVNGQIASGEVNRYRFEAREGQRLVIAAEARQLIPYIADAVPGWFQPVLVLRDAQGKEVAYNDDYRFQPDPVISCEVPADGEYVLSITDALYRGREDFIYRVSLGELPFVTSIFPLGARVGESAKADMKGWNLESAELTALTPETGPGTYLIAASRDGLISNRVPFAIDSLPEATEKEPNGDAAAARKARLPVIMNGRIDRPGDWDVFRIAGKAGDTIVAEVFARRLGSPLDSLIKVTDAAGALVALNDDNEDLGSGVNTHHADSYVMAKLPADGAYYIHLGDTARHGGEEYAYRLRLSSPEPDFALRAAPSSLTMRNRSGATVTVYAVRKDGFNGPIKLSLKDPPEGYSASTVTLPANQQTAKLWIKTTQRATTEPVRLTIEGRASVGDREIVRQAVPAEDRMQAFLWRHLVPAEELLAVVFDPAYQPPPKRVPPPRPAETEEVAAASDTPVEPPKFTKQQVAGRLRQINFLYQEGLLTDEFSAKKIAECEAAR